MHLSGVQIIIKACSGSHKGYSGWRIFLFFFFSPFVLFSVLGDGFSPLHVAEPKVNLQQFSSLGIQHCPCCMKRAERLSPSESSAKKIKQNLSSRVTAGSKTFTKAAGVKPRLEHKAGIWRGSLEQRRYQN